MTVRERDLTRRLAWAWALVAMWASDTMIQRAHDGDWFWFAGDVVCVLCTIGLAVSYWVESR